jgi:hypothetical protein
MKLAEYSREILAAIRRVRAKHYAEKLESNRAKAIELLRVASGYFDQASGKDLVHHEANMQLAGQYLYKARKLNPELKVIVNNNEMTQDAFAATILYMRALSFYNSYKAYADAHSSNMRKDGIDAANEEFKVGTRRYIPKATAWSKKCLEYAPYWTDAYLLHIDCLLAVSNRREAKKYVRAALQRDPNHIRLLQLKNAFGIK